MSAILDRAAAPTALATPGVRDFVALAKPRITLLVVITTLGGFYLAPGQPDTHRLVMAVLGTVLIVTGANALNMYIERASDALMFRTRKRPLPAGKMAPPLALWFGVVLSIVAVPILALGVNLLTAALGVFALLSYVLVYTPLKRRSPTALLVGAIPGAIPPLMGWTAARGVVETPGLLLFAIMFVWQIPHFLAIALHSAEDYARGGIKVLPLVEGERIAKRQIVVFSLALLPVSLSLVPFHVAGPLYFVTALVGGVAFLVVALLGLGRRGDRRWARQLFLASLVYLTALFIVLAVEGPRIG